MWASPVLPLTGRAALEVLDTVELILRHNEFDPLATFTMINERATIGIPNVYYDKATCQPKIWDIYWMFDGPSTYPEYLNDLTVTVCPSDDDKITMSDSVNPSSSDPYGSYFRLCDHGNKIPRLPDISYLYFAWAFNDDNLNVNSLVAMYVQVSGYGNPAITVPQMVANFSQSFTGETDEGDEVEILRLKEGIERFFITDINNPAGSAQAQSTIATMFDKTYELATAFNHVPGGSNVLYMDGHVEFKKYPGDAYPVSKEAVHTWTEWFQFVESLGG